MSEQDPFGLLMSSPMQMVSIVMTGRKDALTVAVGMLKNAGFSFLGGGELYEVRKRDGDTHRFRAEFMVRTEGMSDEEYDK